MKNIHSTVCRFSITWHFSRENPQTDFFLWTVSVVTASPIDGGWSSWSSWSRCSAHCDGGIQERHRECNDPVPNANGHHCTGNNFEWRMCNRQNCDGEFCTFLCSFFWKQLSMNPRQRARRSSSHAYLWRQDVKFCHSCLQSIIKIQIASSFIVTSWFELKLRENKRQSRMQKKTNMGPGIILKATKTIFEFSQLFLEFMIQEASDREPIVKTPQDIWPTCRQGCSRVTFLSSDEQRVARWLGQYVRPFLTEHVYVIRHQ